jgi:hypothetical protein
MASPIVFEGTFHQSIVEEGATLRSILYTPYPGAVQTFYLFLLHLSSLSEEAIMPSHDHPCKAPFSLSAQGAVIASAYYVRKGIKHFGYQITIAQRLTTEVKVFLKSKPITEHLTQPTIHEMVRLYLFGDSSLNPLAYLDFIIRYNSKKQSAGSKRFYIHVLGENLGKNNSMFYPLPYHQSPLPHPSYLETPFKSSQINFPLCVTIADTEIAYTSKFLPWGANFVSWTRLSDHKPEPIPTFPPKTLKKIEPHLSLDDPYSCKLYRTFFNNPNAPTSKTTFKEAGTQTEGMYFMLHHSTLTHPTLSSHTAPLNTSPALKVDQVKFLCFTIKLFVAFLT